MFGVYKRRTIAQVRQQSLDETDLAILRTEETLIRAQVEYKYQVERGKRIKAAMLRAEAQLA